MVIFKRMLWVSFVDHPKKADPLFQFPRYKLSNMCTIWRLSPPPKTGSIYRLLRCNGAPKPVLLHSINPNCKPFLLALNGVPGFVLCKKDLGLHGTVQFIISIYNLIMQLIAMNKFYYLWVCDNKH